MFSKNVSFTDKWSFSHWLDAISNVKKNGREKFDFLNI